MCFNNLLILFDNSPNISFLIFHITPNTIHFLTLSFSLVLFLFVSLSLFLLSNQQLQHTITDAHFPTNPPAIAQQSPPQTHIQWWQFVFAGQVRVVLSHKYPVIWVDPNPTCLVNMLKIINPNTTYLLNRLTRQDMFNLFN